MAPTLSHVALILWKVSLEGVELGGAERQTLLRDDQVSPVHSLHGSDLKEH